MTKKMLKSFDIKNKKVVVTEQEYNVVERDGLFNVYTNINDGWSNLPKSMYERMYGEDLKTIIENRREWLTYNVLPERVKSLREITDEIEILTDWLNNKEKEI